MIYEYICKECGKKTEIDKPLSEQCIPECCGKLMKRVFTVPGIVAGCLNASNLGQ